MTSYENKSIIEDYDKTIAELERIVGEDTIDNVVRLQSFQGSKVGISAIRNTVQPVVGLLTADDDRQSYYLSEVDNDYIYCHDEMVDDSFFLISTDIRAEYVENIDEKLKEFETDSWNNQLGDLVIFSHEWALSKRVKDNIERLCQYAVDNGYMF